MAASELKEWLEGLGIAPCTIESLAGDLSQRRYFRVVPSRGAPLLAVHYPEALLPAMARFSAARSLLADAAVRVPEILQSSPENGWMLVEDMGTATLYEREDLPQEERTGYFRAAAASADKIAGLDAQMVERLGSPSLDAAALSRELEVSFEFLLDPRGLSSLPGKRRDLWLALEELCARLAGDPLVPCHRDYMARNLIPTAESVAVIDFQDLRLGPPAYDIASLLNDSFFPDRALEDSILPERWQRDGGRAQYARAVVQRTLKAGGTFARFAARGNPRHVPLIASTLRRAERHLECLPETAGAFGALRGWWTSLLGSAPFC